MECAIITKDKVGILKPSRRQWLGSRSCTRKLFVANVHATLIYDIFCHLILNDFGNKCRPIIASRAIASYQLVRRTANLSRR